METSKVKNALTLASAGFALANAANTAGVDTAHEGIFSHRYGVYEHAEKAAMAALNVVFDWATIDHIVESIAKTGEFEPSDLVRYAREVMETTAEESPRLWICLFPENPPNGEPFAVVDEKIGGVSRYFDTESNAIEFLRLCQRVNP